MWLKSAVRQLQKWVPTSAEYRDQLRTDAVEIQRARAEAEQPKFGGQPLPHVDTETGEVVRRRDRGRGRASRTPAANSSTPRPNSPTTTPPSVTSATGRGSTTARSTGAWVGAGTTWTTCRIWGTCCEPAGA